MMRWNSWRGVLGEWSGLKHGIWSNMRHKPFMFPDSCLKHRFCVCIALGESLTSVGVQVRYVCGMSNVQQQLWKLKNHPGPQTNRSSPGCKYSAWCVLPLCARGRKKQPALVRVFSVRELFAFLSSCFWQLREECWPGARGTGQTILAACSLGQRAESISFSSCNFQTFTTQPKN